jgi:hypothetical protein
MSRFDEFPRGFVIEIMLFKGNDFSQTDVEPALKD